MAEEYLSHTCDKCSKSFKSAKALKGHHLYCSPKRASATGRSSSKRSRGNDRDEDKSSGQKKRSKLEGTEQRSKRKVKTIKSPLDVYINATHSLDPYPLSYVILHGEESKDDPLLEEARKLFALVYPTIPKDFQLAAVRSHCNTKQDFRSFRTFVLSLQKPGESQVVSCATVKVHKNPGLLEVLFIATNPMLQRRGFGRLLMHLMQDLVRQDGIKLSLACASSDAIPFWKKMGFSMNSTARVHGWRLVQLGGTKIMSQTIDEDESVHRLNIAEALMRLPLENTRRAPSLRGYVKAIPDLHEWVERAKVEIQQRKERGDQDARLWKEEAKRRKMRLQEVRDRTKINRIKPKKIRRIHPGEKKTKSTPEIKATGGRTKTYEKVKRKSHLIYLLDLKRRMRMLPVTDFYIPQDVLYPTSGEEYKPHLEICHRCNKTSGRLLCCDTCVRVWHLRCLPKPIKKFPPREFAWSCPVCKAQSKGLSSRNTRSNTRQQWNMRICSICRRRKLPMQYPEGPWHIPADKRVCDRCLKPSLDDSLASPLNGEDDDIVDLAGDPYSTPNSASVWRKDSLPSWVPDGWRWRKFAQKKQYRSPNGVVCKNKRDVLEWMEEFEPGSIKKYQEVLDHQRKGYCSTCERQFSPQGYARHMRARHNKCPSLETQTDVPTSSVDRSESPDHDIPLSVIDPEMRCALCRELGHGPNGEGRLERAGANLFVHSFCLRFCPLVAEKGGAVKKSRAIREIERGSQMECAVCHKAGATMACGVQGCWKSYHLLCASRAGCKLHKLDFLLGKPPLFCPDHGNLPAAQKATKAKTLQQWTVVFDKPLEEKDRQMENSSAEENGDSHDDSESECLSKALEQSKHAPKPKSKLREKKSQVLQIDQRVKARFKQQWFPGILKRMKQNCGDALGEER
ncbi:hypothetical protein AAMO2058_000559500 [Amorphochlora amoebiformis]